MIYLATPANADRLSVYQQYGIGVMMTPMTGNRITWVQQHPCWAADNGCFSHSERFCLDRYLDWLMRMQPIQGNCLFATAPDVLADPVLTWERSCDVLPEIRALGYRAALVAQDGIERMTIDWDTFDVLFVGGTTHWKLSEAAFALAGAARRAGKWVHMGRVNSQRRLLAAHVGGYNSVDGTLLAFGPDVKLKLLCSWLPGLRRQPSLILV